MLSLALSKRKMVNVELGYMVPKLYSVSLGHETRTLSSWKCVCVRLWIQLLSRTQIFLCSPYACDEVTVNLRHA